jgi:hypothetical protein
VGVGDSLEAPFTLVAPLPAGTWHFVGDAQVLGGCTATFDVVVRHAGQDTPLFHLENRFDIPATGLRFNAVPYESDATAPAAGVAGDQLVLRFGASASDAPGKCYVPNGDGASTGGRVPSLKLPAP